MSGMLHWAQRGPTPRLAATATDLVPLSPREAKDRSMLRSGQHSISAFRLTVVRPSTTQLWWWSEDFRGTVGSKLSELNGKKGQRFTCAANPWYPILKPHSARLITKCCGDCSSSLRIFWMQCPPFKTTPRVRIRYAREPYNVCRYAGVLVESFPIRGDV